ncbi:MAG: amidohydrolase family protein [Deltaproteobacteria bacterium]|nr:amidohydrolase family protein [Deltaproteobacteria bacterium]
MTCIIDFHTHAFPDLVAAQAIPALEEAGKVTACLDGRIESLLVSMNEAGIEKSVLCSIATRPEQFTSILSWSESIRSERIIPFPSFHPDAPEALEQISAIKKAGFSGIKMHPYYQKFVLDEERMWPLYERITAEGLILVMHTGFDIGFPRERIADPLKIVTVVDRVPELKFVATHFGAWDLWDEVDDMLIGRPLYLDLSYALHLLPKAKAKAMALAHPEGYLLFGTDSPWARQREVMAQLSELGLDVRLETKILGENAARLLSS